jgi:hypothetical protein
LAVVVAATVFLACAGEAGAGVAVVVSGAASAAASPRLGRRDTMTSGEAGNCASEKKKSRTRTKQTRLDFFLAFPIIVQSRATPRAQSSSYPFHHRAPVHAQVNRNALWQGVPA